MFLKSSVRSHYYINIKDIKLLDAIFKSLQDGKDFESYKPFIDYAKDESDNISIPIQKENEIDILIIEKLINNIHFLMNSHLLTFHTTHGHLKHNSHSIILSAIYKNFYIFYSSLELLKKGFFGSSRVLLRQSFEFLILGKFCAITNNHKVFENWQDGKTVYFSNEVLKKISKPNTNEIKQFWIVLCKYAHSTSASQQINLNWDDNKKDINLTFSFIILLLDCHYHLLNSILLPNAIKSFINYHDYDGKIKKCRYEINEIFKHRRKIYGEGTKRLVKDYKSTWEINS